MNHVFKIMCNKFVIWYSTLVLHNDFQLSLNEPLKAIHQLRMKSKIEGEIENQKEVQLQQGQLYYTYITTLLYSTLV